jgi:hypothetical protein
MRRYRLIGLLTAASLLAVSCGSSGKTLAPAETPEPSATEAAAQESSAPEPGVYPPNNIDELAEIFNPLVEQFGVRFTRGALVDTADDYNESDTGDHLALYVEPIGDYTDDDYIDGIYDITAVVTPLVYETWSGVNTYDICQEPRPEDDSSAVPPPLTQIFVDREQSGGYDWTTGDLDSMMSYSWGQPEFVVVVAPPLNATPRWTEIYANAGANS